jgi:hypothetical protein
MKKLYGRRRKYGQLGRSREVSWMFLFQTGAGFQAGNQVIHAWI